MCDFPKRSSSALEETADCVAFRADCVRLVLLALNNFRASFCLESIAVPSENVAAAAMYDDVMQKSFIEAHCRTDDAETSYACRQLAILLRTPFERARRRAPAYGVRRRPFA